MGSAFVYDEFATVTGFQHRVVEGLRTFEGADGVACAVEGECGRKSGADVVRGREFLPAVADLGIAVAFF